MGAGLRHPNAYQESLSVSKSPGKHRSQLHRSDPPLNTWCWVMGPWGTGKTSLINLARNELAKDPAIPVLDFSPWMFSGTEQLVDSFFREVSAQLHLKEGRLDAIATEVEAYGDLLSPVADVASVLSALPFSGWLGRARDAANAVKRFQERRKLSVTISDKSSQGTWLHLSNPLL